MAIVIQPARRNYFFGKGYEDLRQTIQESWAANRKSGHDLFAAATRFFDDNPAHWVAGIFLGAAGVSVYLFGTAAFLCTSLFHALILGASFLCVYVLFSIFYLQERLVMLAYRIFVTCPGCYEKTDLPTYKCPHCSVAHTRLIPGPYGILFRRCACGHYLRTSFLTGRTIYQALCPHCDHVIEHAESTPICIPVVGTPFSGKTCFLYAFTEMVCGLLAPEQGWTASPTDEKTRTELEHMRGLITKNTYPRQTTDKHAQAYKLTIRTSSGRPRILHLYDSAGEAFLADDGLKSHRFYGYCHGFAAIIDAPAMLELGGPRWNATADPEDAFVRTLHAFERAHKFRGDQKIAMPLAVVLNKVDDPRVRTRLSAESGLAEDITSLQCYDFLADTGAHQLLAIIRQRYETVQYFAASALCEQDGRLVSAGMEPICRWLLSASHRALRRVASRPAAAHVRLKT